MKMKKIREAIAHFDSGDTRSFNEIYAGREDLFEDVDDVISPRMKALFESVYATVNGESVLRLHLTEENSANPHAGPKPGPDGVPDEINSQALSKGPANSITQSGARQDDDSKLGNEPSMGYGAGPNKPSTSKYVEMEMRDIYEKAQLKESLDDMIDLDDLDDEDEFSFDASEGSGRLEDPDEIDFLDSDSLDDMSDSSFDDIFEDYDDGSDIPGTSDSMDFIEDDLDIF
jgi:hypothetical protein